jgi:hypothetical protein
VLSRGVNGVVVVLIFCIFCILNGEEDEVFVGPACLLIVFSFCLV